MKLCFYSNCLSPWKIHKVELTPCWILRRTSLSFPVFRRPCAMVVCGCYWNILFLIIVFDKFFAFFPTDISTGSVRTSSLSHPGWACDDNSETRRNHWKSQRRDRTPMARRVWRDEGCVCLHWRWLPSKDFQKCVHPDRQRDFPQTLRRWRQDNQK